MERTSPAPPTTDRFLEIVSQYSGNQRATIPSGIGDGDRAGFEIIGAGGGLLEIVGAGGAFDEIIGAGGGSMISTTSEPKGRVS